MIIFTEKRRKLLRNIYRGLGVSALALLFQACYGMGPDGYDDCTIRGRVLSKTGNAPIPGIKVSVKDLDHQCKTDGNGYFYIYVPDQPEYKIKFEDVDGSENGLFKQHKMKIALENLSSSLEIYLEEADEE